MAYLKLHITIFYVSRDIFYKRIKKKKKTCRQYKWAVKVKNVGIKFIKIMTS